MAGMRGMWRVVGQQELVGYWVLGGPGGPGGCGAVPCLCPCAVRYSAAKCAQVQVSGLCAEGAEGSPYLQIAF